MSDRYFPEVVFYGHKGYLDESVMKFPSKQLETAKASINGLGWTIVTKGVRIEYDSLHVILIQTDQEVQEIPGYRVGGPRVNHAILREWDDEIYVTVPSSPFIPAPSVDNINQLISALNHAGVAVVLPPEEVMPRVC